MLFSLILLVMLLVFSLGVLSGLKGDEFPSSLPFSSKNASSYESPVKALANPGTELSSISGTETTLNGIPIKLWMGKAMESARKIKNAYCTRWTREKYIVQDTGNPETGFGNAFDPEKRQFYGILSWDQKDSSAFIPFNIDLKKTKPADSWDEDFPGELRKEKGFHLRSSDKDMHYESFFYTEKYDASRTLSLVKTSLLNAGWEALPPNEALFKKLPENIQSFIKGKKSCLVTVEPLKNHDRGRSMVAIMLGNF